MKTKVKYKDLCNIYKRSIREGILTLWTSEKGTLGYTKCGGDDPCKEEKTTHSKLTLEYEKSRNRHP